MAQKRMFTMKIVDSDAFLDMPLSAQCLYFHLNMRADDDGFVGNPRKIMRMIGASEDDMKLLLAKKFLILFENNVVVIKHWWMHNTLIKDRYHETSYTDEKDQLKLKENRSYTLDGEGIPLLQVQQQNVNEMLTECITNDQQNVNADLGLNLDLNLDKDLNNINNADTIAESEGKVAPINPFVLKDSNKWYLSLSLYQFYQQTYKNINLDSELHKIQAWLISNPARRKLKNGMPRFINNWLSNAKLSGYSGIHKNDHIDLSNKIQLEEWDGE